LVLGMARVNDEGGKSKALVLGDDGADGGSAERGDRGFVVGLKGKIGQLGEGERPLGLKKI